MKYKTYQYEIYQLREETREQNNLLFMASDQAAALGGIHLKNYQRVYTGKLESAADIQRTLDNLYKAFNVHRPKDFTGHSLSVSDVVHLGGEWWYCDPYGWKKLDGEEWNVHPMRHFTKAEWDKIPDAYKGRWEPSPLNLDRVEQGELPAEYIGKRNTIVYEDGRGTTLITEGAQFVIDE